jgi:hypothetical protein
VRVKVPGDETDQALKQRFRVETAGQHRTQLAHVTEKFQMISFFHATSEPGDGMTDQQEETERWLGYFCTARNDSCPQRSRKQLPGRRDIGRQADDGFTPPPKMGQDDGIFTLLSPLAPVGCLCLLQFAEWLQI